MGAHHQWHGIVSSSEQLHDTSASQVGTTVSAPRGQAQTQANIASMLMSSIRLHHEAWFPGCRVRGLVLRGVCLMRPEEIAWMYGGAAAAVQPRAWRAFVEHLGPEERDDVLGSYYRRLQSQDAAIRDAAVRA